MGFRFHKSIKLFPGIRIYLSKSGVSASIGRPGATVNISDRGARGTLGIPGTGISYSEKLSAPEPSAPREGMSFAALLGWGLVALVVWLVLLG